MSRYMIEPIYTSRMTMYVNNNTERLESQLNFSNLNLSQKLVSTYVEILKSDIVLNKVIEEMNLPYSNQGLRGMIKQQRCYEMKQSKNLTHSLSEKDGGRDGKR